MKETNPNSWDWVIGLLCVVATILIILTPIAITAKSDSGYETRKEKVLAELLDTIHEDGKEYHIVTYKKNFLNLEEDDESKIIEKEVDCGYKLLTVTDTKMYFVLDE